MTGQAAGRAWPSGAPPQTAAGLHWELHDVAELPRMRAEVRRHVDGRALLQDARGADLRDQLVLALDEMASNALRHGGGRVQASIRLTDSSYLIAELATDHGWYVRNGAKHVWALLPRG